MRAVIIIVLILSGVLNLTLSYYLKSERSKRTELSQRLREQWKEEDLRVKDCMREKQMLWTRLLELSELIPNDSVAEAEQAKLIDLLWNRDTTLVIDSSEVTDD